jgi:hypothetical protein
MGLRECLTKFHLLFLAILVAISLILIIIGGLLSAWCIKEGNAYTCHSLFHSDEIFSCLFKLIPSGIIFCLSISLLMFSILISIQIYIEYYGITKKEYQLVARFVNILVLSLAIILIMIVLLQWFHPRSHSSKNFIIAMMSDTNDTTNQSVVFETISVNHPAYLRILEIQRQSMVTYGRSINHGPNLFFASFIILLIALLGFVIVNRSKS